MKVIKYFLASTIIALCTTACNDGNLDSINPVAPGPDSQAPTVTINYPVNGTKVRSKQDVTPITFDLEATDDIELQLVSLSLDGTEIMKFDNFKDYRRALEKYTYNILTNGDHTFKVTATDLSGKSTSKSVLFSKVEPYKPKYDGEMFYMPFDGDYLEQMSITFATKVGTAGFLDAGKIHQAYLGATDSYLTSPTQDSISGLNILTEEFSAVFWYKMNSSPDRAGILVVSPKSTNSSATPPPNNMTNGFRLFRESANGGQTIKLNVGTGSDGTWFDGGAKATLQSNDNSWHFIAFSISKTDCNVYIDGQVVSSGTISGVKWNGCDLLSIMSGAPRFVEWNHYSDVSSMDELRFFNKALTQGEIQTIMNANE